MVAGYTDGFFGGGNISAGETDVVAVMLGVDGGSDLDDGVAVSDGGDSGSTGGNGGSDTSSALEAPSDSGGGGDGDGDDVGGGGGNNSTTSSAPALSSGDSSTTASDGGGDVGGVQSNDTAPGVPEASGGSSADDGDIAVSMIVGGLIAATALGGLLIWLVWSWRKRTRTRVRQQLDRRPKKEQTKRPSSSKPSDAAGSSSRSAAGSGFDVENGSNDPDAGGRRCSPQQQQQHQGARADPSTENAVGNPLFDHRNHIGVSAASVSGAASRGLEGGGGGCCNGFEASWKDRGLTAFPSVSADDDVSRCVPGV